MSDTLVISGGTTVATEELFVHAAQLGGLAARAESWALWLARLGHDHGEEWRSAPPSSALLEEAGHQARLLEHNAEKLRASLIASAEAYGVAERTISSWMDVGAQIGAWSLGRSLPLLVILGAVGVAGATITATNFAALFGIPASKMGTQLLGWLQAHPSLLNSPVFVRLVRSAVSSSDEFAMGLSGVALPLAVGLGARVKVEQNAAALTLLATIAGAQNGGSALRETPQKVHQRGGTRETPPPAGIGDLAQRVPGSERGEPQVRIERYGSEENPRWVAYITGTSDFSVKPAVEPFDMTANVHAMAGSTAASEQAVRDALAAAGAAANDELLLVGHSQGGLVAARIAESRDLNVAAYVNLGGPLGSVNTADIPALSIEHADDLITALGGNGESPAGLTTVGRTVLDEAEAAAVASANAPAAPLEAHGLAHYRETAALVSASEEERLQSFDRLVRNFVGEEPGVRTQWRSEREVPSLPSAD